MEHRTGHRGTKPQIWARNGQIVQRHRAAAQLAHPTQCPTGAIAMGRWRQKPTASIDRRANDLMVATRWGDGFQLAADRMVVVKNSAYF